LKHRIQQMHLLTNDAMNHCTVRASSTSTRYTSLPHAVRPPPPPQTIKGLTLLVAPSVSLVFFTLEADNSNSLCPLRKQRHLCCPSLYCIICIYTVQHVLLVHTYVEINTHHFHFQDTSTYVCFPSRALFFTHHHVRLSRISTENHNTLQHKSMAVPQFHHVITHGLPSPTQNPYDHDINITYISSITPFHHNVDSRTLLQSTTIFPTHNKLLVRSLRYTAVTHIRRQTSHNSVTVTALPQQHVTTRTLPQQHPSVRPPPPLVPSVSLVWLAPRPCEVGP
jgi:hypothetical protein